MADILATHGWCNSTYGTSFSNTNMLTTYAEATGSTKIKPTVTLSNNKQYLKQNQITQRIATYIDVTFDATSFSVIGDTSGYWVDCSDDIGAINISNNDGGAIPSWITIDSFTEFEGEITISENTTSSSRYCNLKFEGTGYSVVSQVVRIFQNKTYVTLVTTTNYGYTGGTASYTVNHSPDISYCRFDKPSWITINNSTSEGYNGTITVAQNHDTTQRTGTITVTGESSIGHGITNPTHSVSITQAAHPETKFLTVTNTEMYFDSEGTCTYSEEGWGGEFDIESNGSWTMTGEEDWVSVSYGSSTGSEHCYVYVDNFPGSGEERDCTLRITLDADPSIYGEVYIYQDNY